MAKRDEPQQWLYTRAAKAEATGAWAARRRLAAAMREVIELLTSTDPSEHASKHSLVSHAMVKK